ncbi:MULTISPECIES: hypothetical protein, partial [unclassified Microcoleus]|uniref:hypothetical protein n=1 Tax=unclassified Microcoleus TaxID=2642155 RepID=UPI002FD3EB9F
SNFLSIFAYSFQRSNVLYYVVLLKCEMWVISNINLSSKVSPTRRVWIPKPGTEEKRPLGIPTMKDRALQALVKLARLTRMGSAI